MLKQRSNSNGLHDRRELSRLKTIVKALGERAIDGRTALGRTLIQWKNNLIADLGGRETISTQEQAIVDLAVKTKLILDSIDNWLLTQPLLINKRRRCLLPIVKDRTQSSVDTQNRPVMDT